MVHLSALFIAVVGSSLVSAISVPIGAVEARDDLSLGRTIRDATPDECYIKQFNIYYTQEGLKKGIVSGDIDIDTSPLTEPIILDAFYAHGTSSGVKYLSFDTAEANYTSGAVFPANTAKNTGRIEDIEITHDLTPIMKSGLIDADAFIKAHYQNGTKVFLDWNQTNIPITFKEE